MVFIGFIFGPLRMQVFQWGYQVGYDATRVHCRDWGLTWTLRWKPVHSMAYDEIQAIDSCYLDRASAKRQFYPFDFLALSSHNPDVPVIEIYPIYLKHPDDKLLLKEIYRHRPELFAADVIDYMNSDRPL